MIVDDEPSVVDSLALTIPWDEYGITWVHQAYSIQEALQIGAEHMIDILITDIQMPEMDGFELNKKMKTFSPRLKTIIISGYDDFSFAQKAIRQQTIDYLLKPVNIKLLMKTVGKVIRDIETELKEIHSVQQIKHTLETSMPILKSQLLIEMLKNEPMDFIQLEKRLSVIDDSFHLDDLFTMIVIRLEDGFPGYDLQSMPLIEFAVKNIAEEVFHNQFEIWSCITDEGNIVFLIKSNKREDLKLVSSYAKKLEKYVQTFLKGSISICFSKIGVFPFDIRNSYQTLIHSLKQNRGKNESKFITEESLPSETKIENRINLNEAPTISTLLDTGDWEGAIAKIAHVLGVNDLKNEASQDYLFRVLLHLSSSFSTLAAVGDKPLDDQLGEEFHLFMRKRSLITKQRVFTWAERWVTNFKNQRSTHVENAQTNIVTRVRTYIHENLSEDMSLQTIANKVNLHPVYLSKIYKNVTNETIGDYIYQLRMKRADFLLRHTKLKVTDVGNELGFFSQSHFIKVFKKHFGCTPQKYRDQNN
jgi:two-component system, response regulator YesN